MKVFVRSKLLNPSREPVRRQSTKYKILHFISLDSERIKDSFSDDKDINDQICAGGGSLSNVQSNVKVLSQSLEKEKSFKI